jgi:hypothetical protein
MTWAALALILVVLLRVGKHFAERRREREKFRHYLIGGVRPWWGQR